MRIRAWIIASSASVVTHIGNFGLGTQTRRWIAMAIKTPAHAQWLRLIHLDHLINPSMALDATDSATYVDAMIKVCMLR
jgi:hypothetical protein